MHRMSLLQHGTYIGFLALFMRAHASMLQSAIDYSQSDGYECEQDLLKLARFPSISSLPQHIPDVEAAADWLKLRIELAGLEVSPLTQQPHCTIFDAPSPDSTRHTAECPNLTYKWPPSSSIRRLAPCAAWFAHSAHIWSLRRSTSRPSEIVGFSPF